MISRCYLGVAGAALGLLLGAGGCGNPSDRSMTTPTPDAIADRPEAGHDNAVHDDLEGADAAASAVQVDVDAHRPAMWLSDYKLFRDLRSRVPNAGVIPYQLRDAQFVDGARSQHFLYLPPSTHAVYRGRDVFDFPVGTVLVQTLSFAHDLADPAAGAQTVETRLLIHQTKRWVAVPYLWNADGSDARRAVVGGKTDVTWRQEDGSLHKLQYRTPDMNQCKRCHKNEGVVRPIGTKAGNLNCEIEWAGGHGNQLAHWVALERLEGVPIATDTIPRFPVWHDPTTGTVTQRGRTWLDVNCAHCHNPRGQASVSGLDLSIVQNEPARFGVYKAPVAAGRGSHGYRFGIKPGAPERSFLLARIRSTDPGVMMPPVGRSVVDEGGAALIEEWIAAMPVDPQLEQRALNPVAAYHGALSGGDAARGRDIFYHKIKCITCHTADGPNGGTVGPNLAGIASRRPPEYLLESMVAPSAKIVEKYGTVTVQLDTGRMVTGVLSHEDVYELVLKQIDGKEVSIRKEAIEERSSTPTSIMPAMANLLTVDEVGDLLAFLETLKEP